MTKIALYADQFMLGDATASACEFKLHALRNAGISARVFAQATDRTHVKDLTLTRSRRRLRYNWFYRTAGVHVFEFGWHSLFFPLIAENKNKARCIVSFHGVTPRQVLSPRDRAGYDETMSQIGLAKIADAVICTTSYSASQAQSFGVAPDRIVKIPLPLDLPNVARTPAPDNVRRLLYVGRMMQSKGLVDLLRALASLPDDTPPWSLTVVSNAATADPAYARAVADVLEQPRLKQRVVLRGRVADRGDMARLYAASDLLIVPTYHETYCLPALEAFASGCPVIACASGAVPEITGTLAHLVPTGDVAALAAAITSALRAPLGMVPVGHGQLIARAEFERRARERTAGLTVEKFHADFLSLIARVMAAGPLPVTGLRALLTG